jgi:AcrR family transcriptional regulator
MATTARAARPTRANGAGDNGGSRADRPADGRELRARGRRTLGRLLDAGAQVFADRGYHAARVDDVVKAAETSHGTFYLYFASKEDLFRALAEDAAAAMVELARDLPQLAPDAEGTAALRAWLERFTDLYGRYGAVIRTWTDAEIVESDIGRIGDRLVAEFSRELERRLRSVAPDLDARVAATAIISMIERSHYYVAAGRPKVPCDDLVATLAAVTLASLFGANAAVRVG